MEGLPGGAAPLRFLSSALLGSNLLDFLAQIGGRKALLVAVHAARDAPYDDVGERVSDREHVAEGQGLRARALALHGFYRDLQIAEALIEQHAHDVGLESEPTRVRVPTHNV